MEILTRPIEELNTIEYVSLGCTILSTATICIILLIYYFLRKRVMNFFYELEMLILLANIPLLVAAFIPNDKRDTLCDVFGALRVYSNISLVFLVSMFVRTVQVTVLKNLDESDLDHWKGNYVLIGFIPAVLCALMPFTGNGYVPVDGYCWIDLRAEIFYDWFVFLGFYLLPKAVAVIVVIGFTISTILYLRRYEVIKTSPDFRLLIIYPIVFTIVNPIDLLVRLYVTIHGDMPQWLSLVHITLRQLQGFLYCLVFILSPNVRREIWGMLTGEKNKLNKLSDLEGTFRESPPQNKPNMSLLSQECVTICQMFKIEAKRMDYDRVSYPE